MLLRSSRQQGRRRGAYAVEFAIVSQILFLFIFAHIMGGMAIFDYVQTVNLAREGARWASVHGWQWQQDQIAAGNTTTAVTTSSDVYTNAIAPRTVGLDTNNVNSG